MRFLNVVHTLVGLFLGFRCWAGFRLFRKPRSH